MRGGEDPDLHRASEIRNSLNLASWKDRKPLAAALKPIYQAAMADAAAAALEAFA